MVIKKMVKLSKKQGEIVKLMRKEWLLCEDTLDDEYWLREKHASNYSKHKRIHSLTAYSLIGKNIVVFSKPKSTTTIITYVLSKEYLK